MIKILNVVGNRPHMVKNAVLQKKLCSKHNVVTVHTGQHYDYELSDVFFKEFELKEPKYNMSVGSGSHGETTGRIMCGLEPIIAKENPDVVIVYGDTNSTLAAALTSAKLGYQVAHVEAGLRSYNMKMPEEINRVCVDHISTLLFCPCASAFVNAKQEGLAHRSHVVGDVMVDTLKEYSDKIDATPNEYSGDDYTVATIHREENTVNTGNIRNIFEAFEDYGGRVIFPMHPRTGIVVATHGIHIPKNVTVIKPLGYFEMIKLVKESKCVVTDSGGLQKEAFILEVPCITIRTETEWEETLQNGWNTLVDAQSKKDIVAIMRYYSKNKPTRVSPGVYYGTGFGTGNASDKILDVLTKEYDK